VGSAYARVRRMSSHPAFSYSGTDAKPLKCPVCGELFGKIPEYDSHFLGHQPDEEMAGRWMSARSFERHFKRAK
jgi:hypothetical protein